MRLRERLHEGGGIWGLLLGWDTSKDAAEAFLEVAEGGCRCIVRNAVKYRIKLQTGGERLRA